MSPQKANNVQVKCKQVTVVSNSYGLKLGKTCLYYQYALEVLPEQAIHDTDMINSLVRLARRKLLNSVGPHVNSGFIFVAMQPIEKTENFEVKFKEKSY